MTSGERMVWAAEFVRVMAMPDGGHRNLSAVRSATSLVMIMRDLKADPGILPEERAMLDDVLSNGGDR